MNVDCRLLDNIYTFLSAFICNIDLFNIRNKNHPNLNIDYMLYGI